MAEKSHRWSELPAELKELILQRLGFTDHIRLGAVCVPWRLVISEKLCPLYLRVPSLMLPRNYDDNNNEEVSGPHYNIISLVEKKVHKLCIPEIFGRRCVGSSQGWVATVGVSKSSTFDVRLFNIFSRIEILLPPLTPPTFADIINVRRSVNGITSEYAFDTSDAAYDINYGLSIFTLEEMCDFFIYKAIIYANPDVPSVNNGRDLSVTIIHGDNRKLAFCNVGDESWTIFDYKRYHSFYDDVIYYKDRFYAVSSEGSLVTWDHTSTSLGVIEALLRLEMYFPKRYLVESSGDLLQVLRFQDYDIEPFKTCLFKVFKLDPSGPKWVEVNSLCDRALFVGDNYSLSISVRDVPECKGNSIYFTPYNHDSYHRSGHAGLDFGIFNLEDESITPCYSCDAQLLWPSPIWVTPPYY